MPYIFGFILTMLDRVAGAVRGVFTSKKKAKLNRRRANQQQNNNNTSGQNNNSHHHTGKNNALPTIPLTKEQIEREQQRLLVNADSFVSNGILVETVARGDRDDNDSELFDVEAGTASSGDKGAKKSKKNPYKDRNRMTTVLEPIV